MAPNVFEELKFDLIGCNSLYWNPDYQYNQEPSEVRVRVAGRAKTKAEADIIGNEVEALYTNGPAGRLRRCEAHPGHRICGLHSGEPLRRQARGRDLHRLILGQKEAFAMKLWDIAHSRTGDKGNISNISLIAYDPRTTTCSRRRSPPRR